MTTLNPAQMDEIAARHPASADAVADRLASTRQHLGNVRLGAGHQSPDYQWWHGQAALDGDLIRLRDAVARASRARVSGPSARPEAVDAGAETARPRAMAER